MGGGYSNATRATQFKPYRKGKEIPQYPEKEDLCSRAQENLHLEDIDKSAQDDTKERSVRNTEESGYHIKNPRLCLGFFIYNSKGVLVKRERLLNF